VARAQLAAEREIGRAAALAYINDVLESSQYIPPVTLAWMALGATLSASIDPELEFEIDGDLVPGRENAFILRNSATGNGDFDIPSEMFAMVTDTKTGKPMGSLRAISELGRWIVGVAHYSKAQGGLVGPR
jgi:hypothetical protein